MSDREPGWYWVKFSSSSPWECMERARGEWEGVEPEIIGPRTPSPDEPWRLVPAEATPLMAGVIEEHMDNHGDGAIAWRAALLAAPKP